MLYFVFQRRYLITAIHTIDTNSRVKSCNPTSIFFFFHTIKRIEKLLRNPLFKGVTEQ